MAKGAVRFIAALALLAAAEGAAFGSERQQPFTFGYQTFAEGTRTAEVAMDLVPLKVDSNRNPPVGDRYVVHGGFGYAPTDHVEISGHLMLSQELATRGASLALDGLLERVQIRFGEAGDAPVDLGVVLEVAELYDSMRAGQRLVLERAFGPVRLAANLATEQRWYRGIDVSWLYLPSAGVLWSPAEHATLGLETWARGYFTGSRADAARYDVVDWPFNRRPHVFVGPTFALSFSGFFWSVGAYVRVDEPARAAAVEDRFGRFWIRTVIGLAL